MSHGRSGAAVASLSGVYTALITPTDRQGTVDWQLYKELLDFQAEARVDGVVVGGTTGESPTLEDDELRGLISAARERLPQRVDVIAGTGRNRLSKSLELTGFAAELGLSTVMLVDPYYNAPSSLEIRREHLAPVAARYPGLGLLPYVIPARTGTRLEPVDVERLVRDGVRLAGVKDATGDSAYADELRRLCPQLPILSGDDARTLEMIERPTVRATGVISVVANVVPAAMVSLVARARSGDVAAAHAEAAPLERLFESVTVRVREATPGGGSTEVRSRNPVPIKAAMTLLGAPVGRCRPPLGRLSPAGLRALLSILGELDGRAPGALEPFARRFGGTARGRLDDRQLWPEVAYAEW